MAKDFGQFISPARIKYLKIHNVSFGPLQVATPVIFHTCHHLHFTIASLATQT